MPRDIPGQPVVVERRRAPWRPRLLDMAIAAAVLLPALVFGGVAFQDYRLTRASAERSLLSTLDTLHGHAESLFHFQALALGAAEDRLAGLTDEQVLASTAEHRAHLQSLKRHARETLYIVVFGADGRPIAGSQPAPATRIDASDRDYFTWHRSRAGNEAYVSAPITSRADGAPVFFVTRRRSDPDGGFSGVLAAGIRQSTLAHYWDRASPDPEAAVTLFRGDGTILARRPALQAGSGARFTPESQTMQAVAAREERRIRRGTSPVDATERLIAYRSIEGMPDTYIVHGISVTAALAPWRYRLPIYAAFALAVAAALLSLALLARRHARELQGLNTALEGRAQELETLNATLEQRVEDRTAEIQAHEGRVRLLAREVDHRAKNALAVVQATLRLTARRDVESYARAVEGRVSALARAQTLLAEDRWLGADLGALLKAELAGFVSGSPGGTEPRAELAGPPVRLPPIAAQPVAMLAHELATNAVKHGALSQPGGSVAISWHVTAAPEGETLHLRWHEAGGPPIAGAPGRRGFGTRVLDSVVRGQLAGRLALVWKPEGLVCEITLPLTRLANASERGQLAALAG